jgi:hypothetical protein
MKEGDLGTLTFGENSTARVKFVSEQTYPSSNVQLH